MTTTTTTRQQVGDRLLRLRDEIIVKNHLAGMDVKDAVHELAREVEHIARRVLHSAAELPEEAKRRAYLGYLDADMRLVAMEIVLKEALAGASRSATIAKETAQLKAALARMEARSLAEEKSKELRDELHRLEAQANEAIRSVETRLDKLGVAANKIV